MNIRAVSQYCVLFHDVITLVAEIIFDTVGHGMVVVIQYVGNPVVVGGASRARAVVVFLDFVVCLKFRNHQLRVLTVVVAMENKRLSLFRLEVGLFARHTEC